MFGVKNLFWIEVRLCFWFIFFNVDIYSFVVEIFVYFIMGDVGGVK